MSPSCLNSGRGPRRWLIVALVAAGSLAAAPAWCGPVPGGRHQAGMVATPTATGLSAILDPAWSWLRQLRLGLPWPGSGSGALERAAGSKASPAGRHVRAGGRHGSTSGCHNDEDCDGDPGHTGDPDG